MCVNISKVSLNISTKYLHYSVLIGKLTALLILVSFSDHAVSTTPKTCFDCY